MKQVVFDYEDFVKTDSLSEKVNELSKGAPFFHGYIQVFSELLDEDIVLRIKKAADEVFPGWPFLSVSTAANIVDCELTGKVIVVVNIFESESSRASILQLGFSKMTPTMAAREIYDFANRNYWVKGIELYYTTNGQSTTPFCDSFRALRPNVEVYGGIVCSPLFSEIRSLIYSESFSKNGVMALFLGGDDLHIHIKKISGWRPIGKMFRVNSVDGNIVRELDGLPAYDVYQKYLDIANDENFFENALEFPLAYLHNGTTIARCPMASYEDGSLLMSADIAEGSMVRFSYGDTRTILRDIAEQSEEIKEFCPDVVHIVSCAARREFWSDKAPTFELSALKGLHSVGFFSHGEFAREYHFLNQHNITLVLAGLREGKADKSKRVHSSVSFSTRLPLAQRMATFIRETVYELDQMNGRLSAVSEQVKEKAVNDSMTGLGNRILFDELLNRVYNDENDWTMILFDINGLKYTNDTFGHNAGDKLVQSFAEILKRIYGKECSFRIGGDEFAVMVAATPETITQHQKDLYSSISVYNNAARYPLSVSCGLSGLKKADGQKKSISEWKLDADINMYKDKANIHSMFGFGEQEKYREFISCLISVEEAKDPYTAHHSERVRELTEFIARTLGLSDRTIQVVVNAAHLHDIGKVGISDAILGKPGKLTDDEFSVIKTHPVIGARILLKSNHMQEIVQIVMHHHERYDGKGYPDGLKGEEIPLGSRIIAIADSIDAMTSRRVYRDAMSLQYCYDEIKRNLGLMYDPAIGKVTLDHWQEISNMLLYYAQKYPRNSE